MSLQTILEKIIFEGLYHTSQTLLTNIKTHYKSLPILVTNEQIQWSFAISFHFESQTDICLIDGFGYLYKEKGFVIFFQNLTRTACIGHKQKNLKETPDQPAFLMILKNRLIWALMIVFWYLYKKKG